jgi:uncharacterized protein DUF6812
MSHADGGDRRKERAVFETERHMIVGDVTLPPEGYQSRFSDLLNREEVEFLPLTDVEITEIASGELRQIDFLVVGKAHVRLAYPLGDGPAAGA